MDNRVVTVSFTDARSVFLQAAESLQQDMDNNHFGCAEVFWLLKEPETVKEIVENVFERVRALGVGFTIAPDDLDTGAITAAGMWRGGREC